MATLRLVSLNAGRTMLVGWGGATMSTAIQKRPLDGRVKIGTLGVEGDQQAHRDVHGGPEMALCVYPHEHYAPMGAFLGCELPIPSFGENLTTGGMDEAAVSIGDTFRIGSAVVQVSQPRQPCNTLAKKHGRPDLIVRIMETMCCGWYFRVLEPGLAGAGDAITPLDRPSPSLTVRHAMLAMFLETPDPAMLDAFARCPSLSPGWRRRMGARHERFK